ncbi:MAG TPA: selenium metabolism-associated LysR family transcriptional regulator [Pyrinomonadaceae bacterium]|nr:selenium metabolism-associated LysR family transcriptional regulator [Pyrinomonadaceae bacterium]
MDIRGLEVFLSVAKHLNYTRAGEELNLSQPSVSIRIKQLENELGMKLFEQLGKKVALTDAGLLLVSHARRVIAAIQDAKQALEELQGLERGSLRIGASTTPGMYLIPQIIARFKERYPKIEVHLGIKDTKQVEEGVIRNEFDFGFVGGHLVGDEVDVLAWVTDQLVLVVGPKHPLAKKKSIKAEDLRKEKFILRELGSATRSTIASHLQKSSLAVQTVMEMENPESVKKAVQSGLGIAFISKFAVEIELRAKTLVAVRIHGLDIRRELKIVHRKDKHLSRAAQTFISMAQITSSKDSTR